MNTLETQFVSTVQQYFAENARQFPWRETSNPYHILVSESMLQQTQAPRVVPKYEAFLEQLPTLESLAQAPLPQLLTLWQGLGYNRRALNLQRAAVKILTDFSGQVPSEVADLCTLPGVGPYTATAVRAFAFNLPAVVIETNIRRAYLHHFFPEQEGVGDVELLPIIARTQQEDSPRTWYWALMDYGSYLGDVLPNANRRSKHYTKQSAFEGSHRQIRGGVLRLLTKYSPRSTDELFAELSVAPERLRKCLDELSREGFITESDGVVSIAQ